RCVFRLLILVKGDGDGGAGDAEVEGIDGPGVAGDIQRLRIVAGAAAELRVGHVRWECCEELRSGGRVSLCIDSDAEDSRAALVDGVDVATSVEDDAVERGARDRRHERWGWAGIVDVQALQLPLRILRVEEDAFRGIEGNAIRGLRARGSRDKD